MRRRCRWNGLSDEEIADEPDSTEVDLLQKDSQAIQRSFDYPELLNIVGDLLEQHAV